MIINDTQIKDIFELEEILNGLNLSDSEKQTILDIYQQEKNI